MKKILTGVLVVFFLVLMFASLSFAADAANPAIDAMKKINEKCSKNCTFNVEGTRKEGGQEFKMTAKFAFKDGDNFMAEMFMPGQDLKIVFTPAESWMSENTEAVTIMDDKTSAEGKPKTNIFKALEEEIAKSEITEKKDGDMTVYTFVARDTKKKTDITVDTKLGAYVKSCEYNEKGEVTGTTLFKDWKFDAKIEDSIFAKPAGVKVVKMGAAPAAEEKSAQTPAAEQKK